MTELILDFDAPSVTQTLSTNDGTYPSNGGDPYIAESGLYDSPGTLATTGTIQLYDNNDDTFAQIAAQSTRYGSGGSDTRGVADGLIAVPHNESGIYPDNTTLEVTSMQLQVKAKWTSPDTATGPPQVSLYFTDSGVKTPHNGGSYDEYQTNLNNSANTGNLLPDLSASTYTWVNFDVDGYGGPTMTDLYGFIAGNQYNGITFIVEVSHTIDDGGALGDTTTTMQIAEAYLVIEYDLLGANYTPFDANLEADLGDVRAVFTNN